MKRLSQKKFRAWLQEKGEGVVGYARQDFSCPLATFFAQETGEEWGFGNTLRVQTRGPGVVSLPTWARRFTRYVDTYVDTSITGIEATRVLDRIEDLGPYA